MPQLSRVLSDLLELPFLEVLELLELLEMLGLLEQMELLELLELLGLREPLKLRNLQPGPPMEPQVMLLEVQSVLQQWLQVPAPQVAPVQLPV